MRVFRLVAALACATAALAACAGGGFNVPEAKPLPSLPPTTATQDFSQVVLAGVPGRVTTTTAVMGPGPAALSGLVTGPDGPVPGAVVHLERVVDGGTAVLDTVTDATGKWGAPSILGGRFRVRAFRAPDLALLKPAVFFLSGTEKRTLDITLQRYTGLVATASIAPNPPYVNDPANLVVRVAQQSVDGNGVVRSAGIVGVSVELVGSGQWRVESSNPTFTDGDGIVQWQVRCRSGGEQPLAVLVQEAETLAITVPPCVEVIVPDDGGGGDDGTTTSFPIRRTTTTVRRTTTTTD